MIFKTERLILRPWKEDDADSLYKYIDSQKKDKKNATIKLQVINEYLSVVKFFL